jgi:spermidine synthase
MCDQITDTTDPSVHHVYYTKTPIVKIPSTCQVAVIADTKAYGPALFLGTDPEHMSIQSTVADEIFYHRPFVHGGAALCSHAPKSALVIGGGEGCMARELLKYDTIEVIDQIDWDSELLAYFRRPEVAAQWNGGAYEDPRVRVHCEDAFTSTVWCDRTYDLIYVDLCDPDAGMIEALKELVRRLLPSLNEGGVFLMNAGGVCPGAEGSAGELLGFMEKIAGERRAFSYKTYVPSYMMPWCLVGLADGFTIGNWLKGGICEDEVRDALYYGPSYAECFRRANSEFMVQRRWKGTVSFEDVLWGC